MGNELVESILDCIIVDGDTMVSDVVLRTYLVETIIETMAFAIDNGEVDAANLMGRYQLWY